MKNRISALATALGALSCPVEAGEINTEAALALARKGNCMKCHSIDKRKKAPSYKEIAAKYTREPDAVARLIEHITGSPIVSLPEGDEPHTAPPTEDEDELRNLARWILAK